MMALDVAPRLNSSRNLSARIDTSHDTPETPRALLPTAPRIPDTCVPCRFSSIGSLSPVDVRTPSALNVVVEKSQPEMSSMNPLLSVSTPSAQRLSASRSPASIRLLPLWSVTNDAFSAALRSMNEISPSPSLSISDERNAAGISPGLIQMLFTRSGCR